MDKINVLIVDDHPMFRYGLASLIQEDPSIRVAGEAENGASAMRLIDLLHPDITLLDIRMPGPDGLSMITRIRKSFSETKIIILTAFDNEEFQLKAMTSGAYGYLLKNESYDNIISAIHQVYKGKKILNDKQTNLMLKNMEELTHKSKCEIYHLTEQELTVLGHLSEGDTNEMIAKKMYVSEPTVKRMVNHIIAEMGTNNRTQAVAEAIREGLI